MKQAGIIIRTILNSWDCRVPNKIDKSTDRSLNQAGRNNYSYNPKFVGL